MTATQDWLARLVAYPTVSSDTNLPLIEEIESALANAGAVCERFYDTTGRKRPCWRVWDQMFRAGSCFPAMLMWCR